VPEHAPDHPVNTELVPAVAVSVTDVPSGKSARHPLPHVMPLGLDLTVPLPVAGAQDRDGERRQVEGATRSVTSSSSVITQVSVPSHGRPHPLNTEPAAGCAVNVITRVRGEARQAARSAVDASDCPRSPSRAHVEHDRHGERRVVREVETREIRLQHRAARTRDDDEDRVGRESARRDDDRLRETDAGDQTVGGDRDDRPRAGHEGELAWRNNVALASTAVIVGVRLWPASMKAMRGERAMVFAGPAIVVTVTVTGGKPATVAVAVLTPTLGSGTNRAAAMPSAFVVTVAGETVPPPGNHGERDGDSRLGSSILGDADADRVAGRVTRRGGRNRADLADREYRCRHGFPATTCGNSERADGERRV